MSPELLNIRKQWSDLLDFATRSDSEDEENSRIAKTILVVSSLFIIGWFVYLTYRWDRILGTKFVSWTFMLAVSVAAIALVRHGMLRVARSLFVWSIAFFLGSLAWGYMGIHHPSLFVFPSIILVAALVMKRGEYIALNLSIDAIVFALAQQRYIGGFQFDFQWTENTSYALDVSVIFGLLAIGVRVLNVNLVSARELATKGQQETKALTRIVQRSEERFRSLIENISDIILLVDREGKVRYESPSIRGVLGYDHHEINGRNIVDFVHPDDGRALQSGLSAGFKQGELRLEVRVRHANGSWLTLECIGSVMEDSPGETVAVVTARDISALKEHEEALEQAEERSRSIIQHASDGIVLHDLQSFDVLDANSAYQSMLGYSLDELRTLTLSDVLVCGPEDPENFVETILKSPEGELWNRVSRRKDGSLVDVEISGSLIALSGRRTLLMLVRDITSRKAAEAAFRESERRTRIVAEMTLDYLFEAGLRNDGRLEILWASEGLERLTGRVREEISLEDSWSEVVHPDDVARFRTFVSDVVRTLVPASFECRSKTKEGVERWINISVKPLLGPVDGSISVIGAVKDITQQKKAEEALRDSERTYRGILNSIGDAVYVLDEHSTFLDINGAAERMYGFTREEMIGNTPALVSASGKNDLARVSRFVAEAFKGVPQSFEFWGRKKSGMEFPKDVTLTPGMYFGRPVVIAIGRDISERKNAEAKLSMLAQTIRSVQNLVTLTDLENKLLFVNEAVLREYGYTEQELLGKDAALFKSPDERDSSVLAMTLSGGWQGELINRRKDGSEFPIHLVTSPVRDENNQIIALVGVASNITERKHAEEALRSEAERQGLILRSLPAAFYSMGVTDQFRTTWVSEQVEQIMGYTPGLFLGDTSFWMDRIHPDDRERVLREYRDVLRAGRCSLEYRWLCSDKVYRWFSDQSVLVRGERGVPKEVMGIWLNIDSRKQSEERLALTQFIVDNVSVGIIYSDAEAEIVGVNNRASQMLGYAPHELIGLHIFDIDPNFPPETWKGHRERLRRERADRFETFHRCKDGTLLPVEITSSLIEFSGRELAISFIQDISERRKAQQELELFRHSIAMAADAVYWINSDGSFAYVNQEACRSLGYTTDELMKLKLWDVDKVYPRALWHERWERYKLDRQGGSEQFESHHWRKDGSNFPVEVLSNHLWLGDYELHVAYVRDITARKLSEQQLRESASLLNEAQLTAHMGHYILDVATGTWTNSSAMDAVFGISAEYTRDIDGWMNIVHPSHRAEMLAHLQKHVLENRQAFDKIYRIVRQNDKEVRWVHGLGRLELSGDGQPVKMFGTIQDITEQKSLEEQLVQAQKLESLGTLAGGIAHDINNILHIISGHVELLGRRRFDDGKFALSLERISQACARGGALVKQILTFARRGSMTTEAVRVADVVRETEHILYETFPKTIDVVVHLPKTSPTVAIDPAQLQQTLLNLCINAKDAMEERGTLTITVSEASATEMVHLNPEAVNATHVVISIVDTGTGMDEETKARVFEPFFTTKSKGKGTGLGLAVAYGVVRQQRGFIDVTSQLGKGTTFRIFLPLSEGSQEEALVGMPQDRREIGGTETILIVEDEESLRELSAEHLGVRGYSLIFASNGREGFEQYLRHREDIRIVVTDYGMPEMTGGDLLRRIRVESADLPILIVSGFLEPELIKQLTDAGASAFIHKPVRPNELLRLIRDVLDRRGSYGPGTETMIGPAQ
ncbi:MAG TPA: PAS domain S-box protein [Bacteroidota bacterium]|nr:PAS domain S-box protein [Bacteroidota bacterium]